ncbi:hypothetical protein BKA65DRAFT_167607 [Rhexocercosporidium sp. MPI-PUGE-AT-0058]|nr:hypothetical protein BKA65DRAFT_167607 [Rhexocercosporidium sp. MPI-PUGE-AT-0058]
MAESEETNFSFPLFDVGPEGAAFRLDNEVDEIQREHWAQYRDSNLSYQAELFAVTHGTIVPNGNHAVLLILDFHFAGSIQDGRRFKHVELTVAFGQKDRPIGQKPDPIVKQMAPVGTFGLDTTKESVEHVAEGNANVSAGPSLATVGIGGRYQKTTTVDHMRHAMLHGYRWIHKRNRGTQNAAVWKLDENHASKNGVPPQLRAAILIEVPQDCGPFKAELTVKANVDALYAIGRAVRSTTHIAPVYFDKKDGQWPDFGPSLKDITTNNLTGCDLESIGAAKTPVILTN